MIISIWIFTRWPTYLSRLIRNHPFVDGNKRTREVAVAVSLLLNHKGLHASEKSLEAMVRNLAEDTRGKAEAAEFFRKYVM